MTWCSVKAQGQLYFNIIFPFIPIHHRIKCREYTESRCTLGSAKRLRFISSGLNTKIKATSSVQLLRYKDPFSVWKAFYN